MKHGNIKKYLAAIHFQFQHLDHRADRPMGSGAGVKGSSGIISSVRMVGKAADGSDWKSKQEKDQ